MIIINVIHKFFVPINLRKDKIIPPAINDVKLKYIFGKNCKDYTLIRVYRIITQN